MIEPWIVWVLCTACFAAGVGAGIAVVFKTGCSQVRTMLDHANVMQGHANVAQDLKDKRTAAYYASKRGQEPSARDNRRVRNLAEQAVNGHDDH